MKVEVKGEYDAMLVEYPKLMISREDGIIVLFSAPEKGTCINRNAMYNIGYYASNWAMSCFEYFDGEITLKND